MLKKIIILFLLCCVSLLQAQTKIDSVDTPSYLEDQIYLSLTYNGLMNSPKAVSQNGFSGGISAGFIKDIPFNLNDNFGIGIGLGYGYNAYIQNIKITNENNVTIFSLAEDYKTNWLRLHTIELPFEIRWRNSTLEKYKFWRIYTGIKTSYIFTSKSKFTDFESTLITKNIKQVNKLQYGIIFSAGYSTWNLYIYYGLSPLFKNSSLNNSEALKLNDFKVGLKFYIM